VDGASTLFDSGRFLVLFTNFGPVVAFHRSAMKTLDSTTIVILGSTIVVEPSVLAVGSRTVSLASIKCYS
jgi:hypothetical protein